MKNQLGKLHALANMQNEAAMAALARHNRGISELEQKINTLRSRLFVTADLPDATAPSLSHTSGHFDIWQRWVERELQSLNIQLANARATKEELLVTARQSFARKSATQALLNKQEQEIRIQKRKHFEQELLQEEEGKNLLSF